MSDSVCAWLVGGEEAVGAHASFADADSGGQVANGKRGHERRKGNSANLVPGVQPYPKPKL